MFRKIVSNLPFSPALVGHLGFYANRLRREEATRRLGLIFIVLALVVQSLAVFQPPESANASSDSDMVTGGISSLSDYLAAYDANAKNLRDVLNYVGITREEIAAAQYTTWTIGDKISWGFTPHFSYEQGERQHNITDASGNHITTVYSKPLKLWYSSTLTTIKGWEGYSKSIGWFGMMQACGNLVTYRLPEPPVKKPEPQPEPEPKEETHTESKKCAVHPSIKASSSDCQTCPGNETIWIKDSSCVPNVVRTKTASNTSQGFVTASTVTAQPGDRINYTIMIENTGLNSTSTKLEDNLSDVLEYAEIIDNGGGTLNTTTNVLSWPDITLGPGKKQSRTLTIRLFDEIPSTAKGLSDATSYDCIMTNTFGNSISIRVACPTPKTVEMVTSELPKTGPKINFVFTGIVLAIATYFHARTRQIKKEIRLIRHSINTGTV